MEAVGFFFIPSVLWFCSSGYIQAPPGPLMDGRCACSLKEGLQRICALLSLLLLLNYIF